MFKTLKDFNAGEEHGQFAFQKKHFDGCVENELQKSKSGGRKARYKAVVNGEKYLEQDGSNEDRVKGYIEIYVQQNLVRDD